MSLWIGRSGRILTRGGVIVNCNTCPCTGPSGECCEVASLPDTATATITIGGVTRVFSLHKVGGGGLPIYSVSLFCDCTPPQHADGSSCGWNDPALLDLNTGFPIPWFTYIIISMWCNLDSVYYTGWTVTVEMYRAIGQYLASDPGPIFDYYSGGVYDDMVWVRNFPISSLPNPKFSVNCRPFHLHFEATEGDGLSYPGSFDDFLHGTLYAASPATDICTFPFSTSVVMDVVTP